MYNQEVKEQYLAEKPEKTAYNIRNLFVFSSELEEKFSKDVAEFSLNEIAEMMEKFGFAEPDTIRSRVGILISYADWYCENFNLSGHHIREYTVDMFPYAKYLGPTIIKTPEELTQKILKIFAIDSGQPVLGALCLAWLGIDKSIAVSLKKEQVDTKNRKIYALNGNLIVPDMPKCIRDMLEIYSNTKEAERIQVYSFTVYAEDYGYFLKRMIIKGSKKPGGPLTDKQLVAYIRDFAFKYKEQFGDATALNYTNIQRSGNFYRLHQLAESGIDIRSVKNADKVRMCLGKSKRNHKDNMRMYDAYLEVIGDSQVLEPEHYVDVSDLI